MRTPMVNMLGFLGTNRRSDQVLNGNYETVPGLQPYSKRLLTKLKQIDNYEDIPVGMSRKEYQEGWKKAKENKSSRGKVIHFGHCKCMAKDNHLSKMEAAFLSIPLHSGYPYEYWTKGIDCTLVKKATVTESINCEPLCCLKPISTSLIKQ